jgi:hypothetical protein
MNSIYKLQFRDVQCKNSKYDNYIFLFRKIVSINIIAIVDIFGSFTFLLGIVADTLKIICAGVSSCPKNLDFRVHAARNSPRSRRLYIRASVTHRPDPTQSKIGCEGLGRNSASSEEQFDFRR